MRPLSTQKCVLARASVQLPVRGLRVELRSPAPADRKEWIGLRRANWRYLRTAEPTPSVGSDPCGSAAFDKMVVGAATERSVRLLICSATDGRILGQISLSDISRGCFQSCFVGYWIGRAYAGKGLMTEALSLAIRYAFSNLGLHRVEANVAPGNHASRAVADRCGFRYEGRARRLLHLNGRWRDHERWAIVREH